MTGMMEMLDKNKSFATHVGTLTDGVKFSQNGNGYSNAGELIGKLKDGRIVKMGDDGLTPVTTSELTDVTTPVDLNGVEELVLLTAKKVEPEIKATVDASLNEMDRGQLLAYAQENYGKKLKGNSSADVLRKEIINLGG